MDYLCGPNIIIAVFKCGRGRRVCGNTIQCEKNITCTAGSEDGRGCESRNAGSLSLGDGKARQ